MSVGVEEGAEEVGRAAKRLVHPDTDLGEYNPLPLWGMGGVTDNSHHSWENIGPHKKDWDDKMENEEMETYLVEEVLCCQRRAVLDTTYVFEEKTWNKKRAANSAPLLWVLIKEGAL